MPGDWCNISQKYRETPFPLRPFLIARLVRLSSSFSLRPLVLSFLPSPFRPVIPPPANYAVVVASCHVIKLHLFTMKHDCHQAFDSRAVTHRRFHSVCVDRLLSTDRPRVAVITCRYIILKSISNVLFRGFILKSNLLDLDLSKIEILSFCPGGLRRNYRIFCNEMLCRS